MAEPFSFGFSATLFPMTSSDEDRATSILFAVLNLIQPFRHALLDTIGQKAYKAGGDFSAMLHPSFGGTYSKKDIPDGIITLDQKASWSALVEVKIKGQDLTLPQLDNYLLRAKENKVDALITISNEICASPDMPPLRLKSSNKVFRQIPHYHWSWKFILYSARRILQVSQELNDVERGVLRQFIGFLDHKKSGVTGFTSMPKDWKAFVDKLRDRATPDQGVCEEVVGSWFQETAELALILSSELDKDVEEVISADTAERRREDAVNHIKSSGDLFANFKVPGHKNTLDISLDIDRRVLQFSTLHLAPKSAKTPYKQIEHFLKEFHREGEVDQWGGHKDVRLFAHWPFTKDRTDMTLFDAIQHALDDQLKSSALIREDKDKLKCLELSYTPSGVSSKIQSRTGVISLLEEEIVYFVRNYMVFS